MIAALLLGSAALMAQPVRLQKGMVITGSVKVLHERYQLNADTAANRPLIEIAGNDIVVDFDNAVLQGSNDRTRPDEFYGVAIRIRKGSRNITIRRANLHGFKIAILADSVQGLLIEHCDLSYNWRQHLNSNRQREDISDWMSYHQNDNDEWMRYGAAIYLKQTNKAVIRNNSVTGGQCALMMSSVNDSEVYDNNFSFNSGIGIGMYRSSRNKVFHNRLDYNVRGYSHGRYRRGQDSAGILVFEQSSDNVFAYNSATHSGDGFFLWAGQTTMDKGTGGCNDNFIYGNDFSFAPTNGIEATFSRNVIMKNLVRECNHGIWAGYSYDTDITDNSFSGNGIGIAIEHGQNINIALNGFTDDRTAIKLWSREKQPDDWVYAKLKNTQSMNYWIAANRFTGNQTAIDIMGTDTVVLQGNTKLNVQQNLVVGDRSENIDTTRDEELLDIDYQRDARLASISYNSRPVTVLDKGRESILITEWGPYNFGYPLLWLKKTDSTGHYHFDVLGPSGKWRVKEIQGFTVQGEPAYTLPGTLEAIVDSSVKDRFIRLEYTGPAYTDMFGNMQDSARPASFVYAEFDPHAKWNISWYRWNGDTDPAKGIDALVRVTDQAPFQTAVTDKLDFTWWGEVDKGLPADSFATVATTALDLPKGTYEIGVTADDYVKVWVDEKVIIDAWNASYTNRDEDTHHRVVLPLSKGAHTIKVMHADIKGLATLSFCLKPVTSDLQ